MHTMTTYIAFLRGINIGGHRVSMERLRALFVELNVARVRSHIQTGNIFFDTHDIDRAALTLKVEQHLQSALGYAVPTFLRTVTEVEQVVRIDPFRGVEPTPDTRFLVTFIRQPLPDTFILPLASSKGDYEVIGATPGEVFSVLHRIGDRPTDPVSFIERTCKIKTTSRFYPTLVKILAAAKGECASGAT